MWSSPTLSGHRDEVSAITFCQDKNTLATGSHDHMIKLWDIRQPQGANTIATLSEHTGAINTVAAQDVPPLLCSGSSDLTIRLWNLKTYQCLKTLQGYANWINSVAVHKDGTLLASGSEDGI